MLDSDQLELESDQGLHSLEHCSSDPNAVVNMFRYLGC